MSKFKVYYSVHNGGDGSAYPSWFSSQKLADWDNDNQSEGWGETCTGELEFEGDNIKPLFEVKTEEGYLWDLYSEESKNYEDFKKEFFKKLPKFEAVIKDKNYYSILCNGVEVSTFFQYPGNTSQKGLEKLLVMIKSMYE